MESSNQKLIKKINELLANLKVCSSKTCARYQAFFEDILMQLNKPHIPAKMARKIMGVYGGMGSLSDLVLYKDGELLISETDKFGQNREDIYIICGEIITESGESWPMQDIEYKPD